jgi:hypothetical protein
MSVRRYRRRRWLPICVLHRERRWESAGLPSSRLDCIAAHMCREERYALFETYCQRWLGSRHVGETRIFTDAQRAAKHVPLYRRRHVATVTTGARVITRRSPLGGCNRGHDCLPRLVDRYFDAEHCFDRRKQIRVQLRPGLPADGQHR